MRLFKYFLLIMVILTLSGCNLGNNSSNYSKNDVLDYLNSYISVNDRLKIENGNDLTDIDESEFSRAIDFINYDRKPSRNIDIEYQDYYKEINDLEEIRALISTNRNFRLNEYIYTDSNASVYYANIVDGILTVEYYLYSESADLIERQSFKLMTIDEQAYMEKYSVLYDTFRDVFVKESKITVYEGNYLEIAEYKYDTDSIYYEYNSKEYQRSYVYELEVDEIDDVLTEHIEIYFGGINTTVEYELHNGVYEDYKIKIHNQGHRILKLDVNVDDKDEDINQLTWNILEVDGWDHVKNELETYKLFKDSNEIMIDYTIDVQTNGYGKIVAVKEFEGSLIDDDISLHGYNLESGITLTNIIEARQYFENSYASVSLKYGFNINTIDNFDVVKSEFDEFKEFGILGNFISKNNN